MRIPFDYGREPPGAFGGQLSPTEPITDVPRWLAQDRTLASPAAKTRLIQFGRFAQSKRSKRGDGPPETFNFLGFLHRCGTRRNDRGFTVHRETMNKR